MQHVHASREFKYHDWLERTIRLITTLIGALEAGKSESGQHQDLVEGALQSVPSPWSPNVRPNAQPAKPHPAEHQTEPADATSTPNAYLGVASPLLLKALECEEVGFWRSSHAAAQIWVRASQTCQTAWLRQSCYAQATHGVTKKWSRVIRFQRCLLFCELVA